MVPGPQSENDRLNSPAADCNTVVMARSENREMSVEQLSKRNPVGRAAHALQSVCARNEIKESHAGDVWIIHNLSGALTHMHTLI